MRAGFTLIETLVAISVLLIAVVGPMSIAQQSISAAINAPQQAIARYLAQEGIEYIRAQRDENVLKDNNWLTEIDECINTPCMVDSAFEDISPCSGSCPPLRQGGAHNLYSYEQSHAVTPFTRTISVVELNSHEIRITSTVTWTFRGRNQQVEVANTLLDWQ